MTASKELNSWSAKQAAEWAGIQHRLLLDLLAEGRLPAIRVGRPQYQRMADGTRRKRRAWRWIVPKTAFQRAWENFNPQTCIAEEK
jgi:hypothetical protein